MLSIEEMYVRSKICGGLCFSMSVRGHILKRCSREWVLRYYRLSFEFDWKFWIKMFFEDFCLVGGYILKWLYNVNKFVLTDNYLILKIKKLGFEVKLNS